MNASSSLTQGNIFRALIRFSLPVLLALVLQALYGAVDLAVVGKFAETTDTSGVATGSMLLHTLTCAVTGMAMGITVLVGEYIGRREPEEAGRAVGTGIFLSAVMAVVLSLVLILLAEPLARLMQCPEEAFAKAVSYIRICGGGAVFIIAYNLLGSIFRGLGDSRTPLITVFIACIVNIAGDLLLVWGFHMGASGAALATVLAQAISVVASLVLIRRMDLPFQFHASWIRPDPALLAAELRLGAPIALQEVLVGFSFLLIQSTVNAFGVVYSAAIGVGEKVCAFLMLVPSAFGQSMSAFVAQNMGANQPQRAKHALLNGIALSLTIGVCMFLLSFFRGDLLAQLFQPGPGGDRGGPELPPGLRHRLSSHRGDVRHGGVLQRPGADPVRDGTGAHRGAPGAHPGGTALRPDPECLPLPDRSRHPHVHGSADPALRDHVHPAGAERQARGLPLLTRQPAPQQPSESNIRGADPPWDPRRGFPVNGLSCCRSSHWHRASVWGMSNALQLDWMRAGLEAPARAHPRAVSKALMPASTAASSRSSASAPAIMVRIAVPKAIRETGLSRPGTAPYSMSLPPVSCAFPSGTGALRTARMARSSKRLHGVSVRQGTRSISPVPFPVSAPQLPVPPCLFRRFPV